MRWRGFLGKRYLIHDRDPLYTTDFLSTLADSGIESIKLPPRSPNLNAFTERFVRTILFGEYALRNAIREFMAHYNAGTEPSRIEPANEKLPVHSGIVRWRDG